MVFAVLAALFVGVLMREEIYRLVAVNTLFEKDKIVENFSSLDKAFRSQPISRGDLPVSELPQGTKIALTDDIIAWINERTVTSFLVLHKGQIVHESYHLDTKADDLRIGWALSKPYISALIGILLSEGTIKALEDEVVEYVPTLKGTAYDGARVVDLLQMTSGVAFNEDYLDYDADINRMGRELALGGTMDEFATSLLEKRGEPGEDWLYVSIDAHVLAMVLRSATGKPMTELLAEKLIKPMGLEVGPYILADSNEVAFAPGGINKTTRDFARFGLMYEQNGKLSGRQIVPKNWVEVSTMPTAPTAPGELGYGYHWWVPADAEPGQFMAHGIYGQYIYVDQTRDLVIVTTAADHRFNEPGTHESNLKLFRQIADTL
ncbi:serine hydrolase domain-containing protein [Roseovarius rhodophyticola]|uniref:Serine hydrolase n=1 Tax=Roseovarius rhodophyticola TaxID=3080827 RepID=A0ABZ2TLP6_9RHOB|nr:serine hydrolase [Roseovarius sp. W115]MDV2928967.1 serine hydrolase [Roseovarius sp. W115]